MQIQLTKNSYLFTGKKPVPNSGYKYLIFKIFIHKTKVLPPLKLSHGSKTYFVDMDRIFPVEAQILGFLLTSSSPVKHLTPGWFPGVHTCPILHNI